MEGDTEGDNEALSELTSQEAIEATASEVPPVKSHVTDKPV